MILTVVSSARLRMSLNAEGVSSRVRGEEEEGRESGEEVMWGGRRAGVEKEGAGGARCLLRFVFLGGWGGGMEEEEEVGGWEG